MRRASVDLRQRIINHGADGNCLSQIGYTNSGENR
jgi:hypothetical protein